MQPEEICIFSLFPTLAPKFSFCNIVRSLPEDASVILYLSIPGLKLLTHACVQQPAQLSIPPSPHRVFPTPHGDRPMWGQKEVSTQHARCWIGCYFSHPVGPNPAQGGGGGLWGQDMQGWRERAEFSCVLSIFNLVTNREKWVSEG